MFIVLEKELKKKIINFREVWIKYGKRWKIKKIKLGGGNMYKTVVIEYSPKADNMAQKIEEQANEMLSNGYELVTMSITGTAKAILVFKK